MFGMRNSFAKIITDHSEAIHPTAIAAQEVEETLAELRRHFSLLVQEQQGTAFCSHAIMKEITMEKLEQPMQYAVNFLR